ncbi:phycobiliprotein lyase [Gloeomargarita sp.]
MEFQHLSQLLAHHWGVWVCQRTRFYLDGTPAQHGKAQLEITGLPATSALPLGWMLTWSEQQRPVHRTIVTFDPDSHQFWQDTGDGRPQTGHYTWAPEGVLELHLCLPSGQSIAERLWFAGPNLRLRTVLVQGAAGLESAAFYSDIRRLSL